MPDKIVSEIYIDMRQELYPLVGKRMDMALNHFEEQQYDRCFTAANSIKIVISPEMDENNKKFFDQLTDTIREMLSVIRWDIQGDVSKKHLINDAKNKLPGLIEDYLELIYLEMRNQGIWFPKARKHASFEKQLMEETFGMVINDNVSKKESLSKLSAKDILNLLPTAEIDKLAVKVEIENVLHE